MARQSSQILRWLGGPKRWFIPAARRGTYHGAMRSSRRAANRNTVPQGLLAAAHNRPPWEFMSSAMGTRQAAPEQPAASLCSVRYRCDAFDSALAGGDAKHFQSTDDAFIAARQTALVPKVSGYITAVPLTDDEHVATGDVIARIDDRDYRIRRRRHKSRPHKQHRDYRRAAECAASTDQRQTLRANARSIARAPQAIRRRP
jgi:hypothetical protein